MANAPDYGPLFQASGEASGIDPLLLQAIQQKENPNGDPGLIGPANKSGERARGVMQFLPSTATEQGVNPDDATSSVMGAGRYLAKLREQHNDDLRKVLAHYGGGPGATGYADDVIKIYHGLQNQWGIEPSTGAPDDAAGNQPTTELPPGASFTMNPAQPETKKEQAFSAQEAAKAQASPIRPTQKGTPQGPDVFAQSTKPGSQSETIIPAVDQPAPTPAPAPAPAPASTEASAEDAKARIWGQQQATPPAAAPGSAAPPQPSEADAAKTRMFGGQAPPANQPPPQQPGEPQPSWWQTNVVNPVAKMYDPTQGEPMQYLLGQPALQDFGAGLFQGARNVAQRGNELTQYGNQYPPLADIDRQAAANPLLARPFANTPLADVPGIKDVSLAQTPEQAVATGKRLAKESAAYRQSGPGFWGGAGELTGDLLATYPLGALGWGLRALGTAIPALRGASEVATMAGVPATQNVLTTPGQNWKEAAGEGALGGLTVGGVLGSAVGQLGPRAITQALQDARDLKFNLTQGEAAGGVAKNIEDVTRYLPFSGDAAKVAEHRGRINEILNENMGIPQAGQQANSATMSLARAQAKNLMDQIQKVTIDANRDPNLLNELGDIQARAAAQPMTGTSITGAVNDVLNTIPPNGQLPGGLFHNLIKDGGPLDKLIGGKDSVISSFAQEIKTSLLDAASRADDPNIYGGNPAVLAANRQAVNDFNRGRYYWKTIKTVEPLVDKTGSADDATYNALARRIQGTPANPNFDPRFTGPNQDMQKLARVLNGPLKALPESGTGRQMITAHLLGLGGEGGLGAATALLRPENFGTYLQTVVAPTLGAIGLGRLSRYPGVVNNPLMPRVAGPYLGSNLPTNPLLNQGQQGP